MFFRKPDDDREKRSAEKYELAKKIIQEIPSALALLVLFNEAGKEMPLLSVKQREALLIEAVKYNRTDVITWLIAKGHVAVSDDLLKLLDFKSPQKTLKELYLSDRDTPTEVLELISTEVSKIEQSILTAAQTLITAYIANAIKQLNHAPNDKQQISLLKTRLELFKNWFHDKGQRQQFTLDYVCQIKVNPMLEKIKRLDDMFSLEEHQADTSKQARPH